MDELDPVIHAAARLRITATLGTLPAGDRIAFPRLQELLDMTAGNLSTHLRKLEDAGYVVVDKDLPGPYPGDLPRAHQARPPRVRGLHRSLRTLLGETP